MDISLEELRKKKLTQLKLNPFQINKFIRTTNIEKIIGDFSCLVREELEKLGGEASVAGRIMRMRNFGNLVFADLSDQTGIIQLMVSNNKSFQELDIGDIIGVEGVVTKTQKGELSIKLNE